MGRHRGADVPATPRQRRAAELLGVAIGLGAVATVAGVVGFGINVAPSVQADELPQSPKVVEPADEAPPAAGQVQPIFDFDDVVPWDPGKDGSVVVDGLPLDHPRSTGSTATRTTRTPAEPEVADPAAPPTTPPPPPPPPPASDPLTDDGEFGDGCEQPGTPERCDPVVGLPPVVIPPVVDDTEEPPEEPDEQEPAADDPEGAKSDDAPTDEQTTP